MNILKTSGIGFETFQIIGIEGFQMTRIGNGIAQSEFDPTLIMSIDLFLLLRGSGFGRKYFPEMSWNILEIHLSILTLSNKMACNR